MSFTYVNGDPGVVSSSAVGNVNSAMSIMNGHATQAINQASNLADRLVNFISPEASGASFGLNTTPLPDTLTTLPYLTAPVFPEVVKPSTTVFTDTIDSDALTLPVDRVVPTFDDSSSVSIALPIQPQFNVPVSPVKPQVSIFNYAGELTLENPTAPQLLSINTDYSLPEIIIPSFTSIEPIAFDADVDQTPFTYSEEPYSDSLLEKVISVLLRRLDGGTGLNSTVEQAIWDRGKDRESATAIIAERTLLTERTAQGFSRPTGSILSALTTITQNLQSKLIELSREVMIKQADLEQLNLREAIQQTRELEATLIDQSLRINQRLFEAAKYSKEFFLEVFKVQMSRYQMLVEVYKTNVEIYTAKIKAEQFKLEIFSSQLKAEELKLGVNKNLVDIYNTQLQANKIQAEIYQIFVNAVSDRLKGEALKIDLYKAEVEAYGSLISAQTAIQQAYGEAVKAESSKVAIEELKARTFSAKVEAYAAATKADTDRFSQQLSQNEFKLKSFLAKSEAWVSSAKLQQAYYDSTLTAYRSQNEVFATQVSLAKLQADVSIADKANQLQRDKNAADISLANAKLLSEASLGKYNAAIEAMKGAGSTYATLATTAMGAMHISSSLSSGTSYSGQEQHNFTD